MVLYDDYNIPDIEEFVEWYELAEEYESGEYDDDDIIYMRDSITRSNWYDFVGDLEYADSKINNPIIAIASLGLWSGRVNAYRSFMTLPEITDCTEDYNVFEVDRYGNLNLTAIHHDGTNYITFREWKDGLSLTQINNFCDKLYNGKATKRDITRYTKAIGKHFM